MSEPAIIIACGALIVATMASCLSWIAIVIVRIMRSRQNRLSKEQYAINADLIQRTEWLLEQVEELSQGTLRIRPSNTQHN